MKEISIPSSILQYIPKEWHINPCQNMQPPYRSWLMHCSSLEPLQNCFTFCDSASQNSIPAKESFFIHQPKRDGEPEPAVKSNGVKPSEHGVCSKLERCWPGACDCIFRTGGNLLYLPPVANTLPKIQKFGLSTSPPSTAPVVFD